MCHIHYSWQLYSLLFKGAKNSPDIPKVINPAVNSDGDNTTAAVVIVENNTSNEGSDLPSTNDKSKKDDVANQDGKETNEEAGGEEGDEEPIDMSFPKGGDWKKILLYLISFPIMFPLYYTLPDTKKPKSKFVFVFSLYTIIE